MSPLETLAVAASLLSLEALAVHVVLAHPRAVFHPCTCGFRGGAVAVAATLIGYDDRGVAAGTTTRRSNRDRLLPLHRRVTMLDRYSNSTSAAQRV
jgi:hypothetical protein